MASINNQIYDTHRPYMEVNCENKPKVTQETRKEKERNLIPNAFLSRCFFKKQVFSFLNLQQRMFCNVSEREENSCASEMGR